MSTYKIGQTLYDVSLGEKGSVELQTYTVATIKSARRTKWKMENDEIRLRLGQPKRVYPKVVTAILNSPWTWVKKSKKHGDWGWSDNIDPLWKATTPVGTEFTHLFTTPLAAYKDALRHVETYIDEPEHQEQARRTIKSQMTKLKNRKAKA